MKLTRKGRLLATLLAVASLAAFWVSFAVAERHQRGDLIVTLKGRISPRTLPRHGFAPARVTVSSRLSTTDGAPPPRVRRIELAFAGQNGSFGRDGLPVCPPGRIRNATDAQALARCGRALVGRGRLEAVLLLPHQTPLRLHARLLDFNGRTAGGRPVVWVHAFSPRPPASFVLAFVTHHRAGAFPSTLTATMPRSAGPWTHLTGFQMTLGRRFRHGGVLRSYLNGSCPAPPHFTAGFFPLARITYTFAGGGGISGTTVRGCRVRS